MQKNVASQKWVVFAFDRTDNTPKTGDAAQITANLRIDGGAANAVDDTNPTELEDGYYVFDITAAESNGDMILLSPASSTSDIQVIGCPAVAITTAPNYNTLGIESDGDLTKVNLCDTTTTNTDMYSSTMRGTDSAFLAASAPANFSSLGIEADGDLTKVNTLDGQTAQTGDSYAIANSGTFGNSALKTLIDALNDLSSADVLTTALTESYGAATAERTLTQLLYEIKSMLTNFSIAGTTYTSKKIDGTTTAKAYTLNDATTPTAIEETI